jgi:hypothetical protein
VTTLIGLWFAWRVVRTLGTVAVVTAIAVLMLGSVAGRHDANALRHVSQPLPRQLEHTSQKALMR